VQNWPIFSQQTVRNFIRLGKSWKARFSIFLQPQVWSGLSYDCYQGNTDDTQNMKALFQVTFNNPLGITVLKSCRPFFEITGNSSEAAIKRTHPRNFPQSPDNIKRSGYQMLPKISACHHPINAVVVIYWQWSKACPSSKRYKVFKRRDSRLQQRYAVWFDARMCRYVKCTAWWRGNKEEENKNYERKYFRAVLFYRAIWISGLHFAGLCACAGGFFLKVFRSRQCASYLWLNPLFRTIS